MECTCRPEIRAKLDEHDNRLESIDKALNGNGHEGLKTRVARTETKVSIILWLTGTCTTAIVAAVAKLFIFA